MHVDSDHYSIEAEKNVAIGFGRVRLFIYIFIYLCVYTYKLRTMDIHEIT